MYMYVDMGMDLQGSIKGPNKNTAIVLMMLVYVTRARARARAPLTQASSAQLGLHFSRVGAFDALLKTARFQRITEAIPEPSLCVSEVLLMLMMRSS